MSYKVITPLVIVPNADEVSGDGYFYQDAVIPSGFNDERCKQLVKDGMLEQASADSGTDDGPPAKSANKGDWEAYARSQGATDADLEGKTKDDLVDAYGSSE